MYQGFLNGMKRPQVTYYENEKKNAVATKITDTAVSTLENNINEQYISLVVRMLFDRQGDIVSDMEAADITETVLSKIQRAKDITQRFSIMLGSLVQAYDKLTASF